MKQFVDNPQQSKPAKHALVTLFAMSLAFSVIAGYAIHRSRIARQSQVRPFQVDAKWMRAAGPPAYSSYFRKSFRLSGNVRHAWMMIAARDGFEVTVNGNPVSRFYLWRPTRPFQTGMSAPGQRIASDSSALALNFPREYQWAGHDSFRVPVFADIASELTPGTNVIGIEVETRRAPASVSMQGEVLLESGLRVDLASGSSWRAVAVPPGIQPVPWSDPQHKDDDWLAAVQAEAPQGKMYRTVPPMLFSTPFEATWMRHPMARASDEVTFETKWSFQQQPDEAWLRIAANRYFDLSVNGYPVRVASNHGVQLDNGNWLLGRRKPWRLSAVPELLDPDEVGSHFVGNRFESPRHGDPTADTLAESENILNRTRDKPRATNRNDMPGTYDPKRTLAETRRTPDGPYSYPEQRTPKALSRDQSVGGLLGYNISNLLHAGDNILCIRLAQPLTTVPFAWPGQMAVDGQARLANGVKVALGRQQTWTSRLNRKQEKTAVVTLGPANRAGLSRPTLNYRGVAIPAHHPTQSWPFWVGVTMSVVFVAVLLIVAAGWKLQRGSFIEAVRAAAPVLVGVMFASAVVLLTALLLETSMLERHESLWFCQPQSWWLLFGTAMAIAFLTGLVDILGRLPLNRIRSRGHSVERTIRCLPQTGFWKFTILWLLMLCGFLRAYKLDFQPLDDDEYASTQAVVAIAETGVPGFVPDGVWYTRSPLFHYSMGAFAWMFGSNLWALRLPAAAFGVGTAWLAYLCGSRLLKNPWVGLGALLLLSIHPFQIYTGHIIRFYQMQQFFALLTVWCFCKGFVTEQSQGYRYATIVSFLAAVLSQEISAVMGVPLAVGYLLFARDKGWGPNIKLIVVAACALLAIVLDFAVFQTRCLTRVEGVSVSMEAAVKPHFWHPYNFVSIFIGYSRLHLLLSAFLLVGMPFVWRERNRNAIALHFMLICGVALTNLLVTHVSLRYQYWLIPIWVLLSLDGMRALLLKVCSSVYDPVFQRNRHMWSLSVASCVMFAGIVLSWSPWRILDSYDQKILGDSTGAFRYVRSQLRDCDVIAATEPHTHAGYLESGRIDFDISVPLLYDFAVLQDGRLVDRNGGAEVVSNLQQFQQVCAKHERVWVLLNREKFRSRGKNLRWEYPGARFELFIRRNCELKHRSYLWSVFLWDRSRGFYEPFRKGGA